MGYCKFKEDCKRKHLRTECEDLDKCKSIKSCHKRYSKICEKGAFGNFRFGESCANKNNKPTENVDNAELKIKKLDKVLHVMTRKVLSLESEVEELNKKDINEVKEKVSEVTKGKYQYKSFKSKITSTPKKMLLRKWSTKKMYSAVQSVNM